MPSDLIPKGIINYLEVIDKQPENWGRVKGGKKTYKILLEKYGVKEIQRRQINGGVNSAKIRNGKPFKLEINDPFFLEFYGILLGDGWIGRYPYKNKSAHIIGISGHSKLDRKFFIYCQKNIEKLFNRRGYLKEKMKSKSIELQIGHKILLETLNKELGFPIGKKGRGLKINHKILSLKFNKLRYVIRGIFDTDGSFYLDKTPANNYYPCISIQMKAPILIKQLKDILVEQGFKVLYREKKDMITLKGKIQLKKWMNEIGSSNSKHLDKINALVAQSGLERQPPKL